MRDGEPRVLTPRDGWDWLLQAARLLWRRPGLFVAAALLAPVGSALLLVLPVWAWLPSWSWLSVFVTVVCYGLPLSLTVALACALARAASRKRLPAISQLLHRTALKTLLRTTLFVFLLLVQGYLLAYWGLGRWLAAVAAAGSQAVDAAPTAFGVTNTVLGTQLSVLGGVVLVLQIPLACFVIPLHLFRELPLLVCWRRSALALQLNPWLLPMLGLAGLTLAILPFFTPFSILCQMLALPLPVYLGAVLYVAWNDLFQGGTEAQETEAVADAWRAEVEGEPVTRAHAVKPVKRGLCGRT